MNFERDVASVLRTWSGRPLRWPSRAGWTATDLGTDGVLIQVDIPSTALADNFQDDTPSSPFFALCTAWWLQRALDRPVRARVCIIGSPPTGGTPLLHWRRAQFLLHELSLALGDRFEVHPGSDWAWPLSPVLNAARKTRADQHDRDPLSEHALEVQIAGSARLLAEFNEHVAPIAHFRRQLPLGLFEGTVTQATRHTPGGASQVDLWGPSPDGRVVHLFELKTHKNVQVGILSEAVYYGRLLHHLRLGRVGGGGAELDAVRNAERLVFWLLAPAYHPLVFHQNESPLAWINQAMAPDGIEFRVLPISLDPQGVVRWLPDARWPAR